MEIGAFQTWVYCIIGMKAQSFLVLLFYFVVLVSTYFSPLACIGQITKQTKKSSVK